MVHSPADWPVTCRCIGRSRYSGDTRARPASCQTAKIGMVWEQRWHPLRREWVIISSHRNERPWQGERVAEAERSLPPYVPDCYLCPGNARSSGRRNERYSGVYVFDNDHPCVGAEAPSPPATPAPMYRNSPASGCVGVVCYAPPHDLTLAQLPESEVSVLLQALQAEFREFGAH